MKRKVSAGRLKTTHSPRPAASESGVEGALVGSRASQVRRALGNAQGLLGRGIPSEVAPLPRGRSEQPFPLFTGYIGPICVYIYIYRAGGRFELLEGCTWLRHRPIRPRWMTLTEIFAGTFFFWTAQIRHYSTRFYTQRVAKFSWWASGLVALFKKGKKTAQEGEGAKCISNLYIPYQKDFYTPSRFSTGRLPAKLPLQKSL